MAATIAGVAPTPNTLPSYWIESGDLINYDNFDKLYYDIDRREKKTLIRNGESYDWHWKNPDKRYIELYTVGRNTRQELIDLEHLPVQSQYNIRTWNNEHWVDHTQPSAGDGLPDQYARPLNVVPIEHCNNGVPPLLVRIPNLNQSSTSPVTHTAYFTVTFKAKISFKVMGEIHTYTDNRTLVTDDPLFRMQHSADGEIMQTLEAFGGPAGKTYPTTAETQDRDQLTETTQWRLPQRQNTYS